jgi:hypothetical protein
MTVTAPETVRLRLDPDPSRGAVLDGGWWPRTTDAVAELPSLIEAVGGRRGVVTHVLLNVGDWDLPHPHRVAECRTGARLGWYTAQPSGLVTIMTEFGLDRFDLFVVPPDATPQSAERAMTAAADPTDGRRASALLAKIDHTADPSSKPRPSEASRQVA